MTDIQKMTSMMEIAAIIKKMAASRCWICGENATTGEHKTKRSDLRTVFGKATQDRPLYYHDANKRNQLIRSLDAAVLKSPARICAYCNNARTQPHDRAWEQLFASLRGRNPPLKAGDVVRANRIFPNDTTRAMLNVHLYFIKLFGCMIVEGNVPMDITSFAESIINTRAHPNVYLHLAHGPLLDGKGVTGRSDMKATKRNDDGRCVFAIWLYQIDGITVVVTFATNEVTWQIPRHMWHPRFGTNKLVVGDFNETPGSANTSQ